MLEIQRLGKTYGIGEKATHAIGDVSFSVADGEFVCVVCPSGCGKTKLLQFIAGLLQPIHGEIPTLVQNPRNFARRLALYGCRGGGRRGAHDDSASNLWKLR